jgi:hypothetical protein
MKNKRLPTFWILGLVMTFCGFFIIGYDEAAFGDSTPSGASMLLIIWGFIITAVFAIYMLLRIWKLDICKTTVKIWLLGIVLSFMGGFIEGYNESRDGLSIVLIFGGNLTCLVCLIRASYLLYKTPDIAKV